MSKITRSPFTVIIDTKETNPWSFDNIPGMKGEGRIEVPTRRMTMGTGMGDYGIAEARCAKACWQMSIERKSIDDLFGSILGRRRLLEEEMANLNRMKYAAVMVEGPLEKVITYHPSYWEDQGMTEEQQLSKQRVVIGTIRSWSMKYPRVDWWFLSRSMCPIWAYRLMWKFWKDYKE